MIVVLMYRWSSGMVLALNERCSGFAPWTILTFTRRRSETRYVIDTATAESWQEHQGPDQIKYETVTAPIRPSGGGGSGGTVNSEKLKN